MLVAVNYAPLPSQCYVTLPLSELDGKKWKLKDLLGVATYTRDGNDLHSRGLYLDVPAWHSHIFEFQEALKEMERVLEVAA